MRYGKVLRSKNIQEKFDYAVKYYEEGDCYKALPIFDELIGIVRGTALYEDVYYYYAKTNYCVGDYYLSNYYSKNFARTFTTSAKAEELMFLSAMSSYNNSPNYSLDQKDTKAALDEFQFFLDNYPGSNLKDSCENMMLRLSYKLEKKTFEVAQLYVKTQKYKSATIALETMLDKYPDSQFREELYFLKIESWYEYAEASIENKQDERYRQCVSSYYTFIKFFPNSEMTKEAEQYYKLTFDKLQTIGEKKEELVLLELNNIIKSDDSLESKKEAIVQIQDFYRPYEKEIMDAAEVLSENKNHKATIDLLEFAEKKFSFPNYPLKRNYLLLMSKYSLAETALDSKKAESYREFIKSYSTFASDFPDSTYLPEAEKLYENAVKQLELIESE
jgi:outer membrane protein assembly factor BamD